MTRQGIFLADGPSDLPLSRHLEEICSGLGTDVALTAVDPRLLGDVGRTVAGRLRFLRDEGFPFDLVFVHRDAEGQEPDLRRMEVASGAAAAGVTSPVVPVVPIRMTEAWLLLDEAAIRRVASKPLGTVPLGLPTPAEAERLSDPKEFLAEVLLRASGTTGRRRQQFVRDFGRHRARLLELLDVTGPVKGLVAWQQLYADTAAALAALDDVGRP